MSNTTQALSRIEAILDDSSFVEIGAGVTARSTDFNIQEKKAPSDGVITGYGVINGFFSCISINLCITTGCHTEYAG